VNRFLISKNPVVAVRQLRASLPATLEAWETVPLGHYDPSEYPIIRNVTYGSTPDINSKYKDSGASPKAKQINNLLGIEFHAVFSYCLLLCRYPHPLLADPEFVAGALKIIADETSHFDMLQSVFEKEGFEFGKQFPVKDHILKDLQKCDSLKDHIALISLTHEGRAIDSKPFAVPKFSQFQDPELSRMLDKILFDEADHVKFGVKWVSELCVRDGTDRREYYLDFLNRFGLKIFQTNDAERKELGFDFYH
jgi:uncharacterized ferritin-like protein (DUF455 family)